jgi:hypothetical protein
MNVLIWAVFIGGALTARYFFGSQGRLFYLVIVLLVIVLFRQQLVVGLTHVASKLGLMKSTIDKMPDSITLNRTRLVDDAAQPVAEQLERAGFVDAGSWIIRELPKIRLALLVHPVENFLAAIETASSIGAQVNIHTLYTNGSVMTFTNSKLPSAKRQRPGMTNIRVPGATVDALVAKARAARRRDGISAVKEEDAASLYERLYAEAIQFRKAQGA